MRLEKGLKFIWHRREREDERINKRIKPQKNLLTEAVEKDELSALFASYIDFCNSDGKIPNLAGFCRYFGGGIEDILRLREERSELYGALCASLEDEAINSNMSSSVLSVYLKQRLGYLGEKSTEKEQEAAGVHLVFNHDPFADGE